MLIIILSILRFAFNIIDKEKKPNTENSESNFIPSNSKSNFQIQDY